MPEPFHVVIIGGGIGGLTLAQGLKQAGISAAVYERDRTLT
jgi:salicylate hydroxylase